MHLQIAEFTIGRSRDVGWSAQRARILGSLAGLPNRRLNDFGKSVDLVVGLVVSSGNSGTIQFGLLIGDNDQHVQAIVRVQPNRKLEQRRAPTGGERAASTPEAKDLPFHQARPLVDDLEVDRSGMSITVRLSVALPGDAETIAPEVASEWSTALATRSTRDVLSASLRRISELAENLRAAHQRGIDLERELSHIRKLNETLALLALVASKTDNGVIILDQDSHVEWVNDGFVRMTGYEMLEVQGMPIREVLYGPHGSSDAATEMDSALATGHGISQDILHCRKDGRTYWASVSITPVFNDAGVVTRWIGIADDATRRRHAQEMLQKAKEEAEAGSRAKSEFLANMSHEIRTPMNAIIGMTELALATNVDDEQREYLTTVLDSAESLLRLLNDILDLSKIEARKLQIESYEFPLAETLRDTLKAFSFQARQKDVRLDLNLPLDVPERVIGDAARLRQILTNLVGNAIKFTEQGEVIVSVECTHRDACRAELSFEVSDTGIGISREKLVQIFEAFTQADSSTSRRFGGTGLGLTISTQLVELMGGHFSVESAEGVGSHFRFSIPLALPTGYPEADAAISGDQLPGGPLESAGAHVVRRPLRILIADDNRANRQLAVRILEKRGDELKEAASGHQVLELLSKELFDVILMDIQMPGMDGLETTASIRHLQPPPTVRPYIIAMTAHAMRGDRERCMAAGMDAYIAKPVRSRKLMALVDAVEANRDERFIVQQPVPTPIGADDFSSALKRLEGDRDLLVEQMQFFLEDSPILVRDIGNAAANRDAQNLQLSAHRLRGLAAGFDASDVVDACRRLEEKGRTGELDGAHEVHRTLVHRWEDLRAAVEQYVRASQRTPGHGE